MKNYVERKLMNTIKKLELTKDDVIQEAELIEECGEWLHTDLIGYNSFDLYTAAEAM